MYSASFEDVDVLLSERGWQRDPSKDDAYCPSSMEYRSAAFPTLRLIVGELGTATAFAAVENDRGMQFADCDLASYYEEEALDYLGTLLRQLDGGVYANFL